MMITTTFVTPLSLSHHVKSQRQKAKSSITTAPKCPIQNSIPMERVLGVDYGNRRVGLAVSVGISPRPLPSLHHITTETETKKAISKRVASAAIKSICETIVVGMPLQLHDGLETGEQVEITHAFIESLCEQVPWATIYSLDERLTTSLARDRIKEFGLLGSVDLDSMSAVILLERYFNHDQHDSLPVLIQQGKDDDEISVQDKQESIGFEDWKKEIIKKAQISQAEIEANNKIRKKKKKTRRRK